MTRLKYWFRVWYLETYGTRAPISGFGLILKLFSRLLAGSTGLSVVSAMLCTSNKGWSGERALFGRVCTQAQMDAIIEKNWTDEDLPNGEHQCFSATVESAGFCLRAFPLDGTGSVTLGLRGGGATTPMPTLSPDHERCAEYVAKNVSRLWLMRVNLDGLAGYVPGKNGVCGVWGFTILLIVGCLY